MNNLSLQFYLWFIFQNSDAYLFKRTCSMKKRTLANWPIGALFEMTHCGFTSPYWTYFNYQYGNMSRDLHVTDIHVNQNIDTFTSRPTSINQIKSKFKLFNSILFNSNCLIPQLCNWIKKIIHFLYCTNKNIRMKTWEIGKKINTNQFPYSQ